MRKFEVVSKYKDVKLPERSTANSAGYDFFAIEDIILKAKETTLIPTGIKATFPNDEVLMLFNRSSNGIKKNLIIPNSVGIIDADYFNNETNEGEISFAFYNANDADYQIHKGDKLGQGIFVKFGITDDDNASGKRSGGFGSTDIEKSKPSRKIESGKAVAYVDGSYNINTKEYGSGVLLLVGDKEYEFYQKGNDINKASMRNVAGEIDAAMLAVEKAKELGCDTLEINYDYNGIMMWPTGKWKANLSWTREYAWFMKGCGIAVKYRHIKGHSGDLGNERADELAKKAVGL